MPGSLGCTDGDGLHGPTQPAALIYDPLVGGFVPTRGTTASAAQLAAVA